MRGLRQKANLFLPDMILADSEFNRRDLVEYGIDPSRLQVLELPLPDGFIPAPRPPSCPGEVEILFVGRFVPAKGVLDLVESVIAARARSAARLRLTLAGDTTGPIPITCKPSPAGSSPRTPGGTSGSPAICADGSVGRVPARPHTRHSVLPRGLLPAGD